MVVSVGNAPWTPWTCLEESLSVVIFIGLQVIATPQSNQHGIGALGAWSP